MRPGVEVTTRDSSPPRTPPTDTATWFVTGITEWGPNSAVLVSSLEDFKTEFGGRLSYSVLYDSVEAFFAEGGPRAYVGRVLGPSPVRAFANIFDQAGSTSPGDVALVATAKDYGEYGNGLNVEVTVSGSDFTIIVSHDTDGVLENSGTLADRAAAVTWSEVSDYLTITLGASAEDPRAQGPTSLTTGADDHASIAESNWEAALNLFTRDLGPGQVSAPGHATTQGHTDLLEHAEANNRVAILDTTNTSTVSTLRTTGTTARALGGSEFGGLFTPWLTIPGITASTTRTVPPSPIVAAVIARSDGLGSQNQPAAGENGLVNYPTGSAVTITSETDLENLSNDGVNVIREIYGGLRVYGFRTLVNKDTSPLHWQLANARLFMAVRAKGEAIGERYVFRKVDGQGKTLGDYQGELIAMLLPYHLDGSLYGTTPADSFAVDVGEGVNPVASIEDGIIKAVVSLKASPMGELVRLEIVRRRISEVLA